MRQNSLLWVVVPLVVVVVAFSWLRAIRDCQLGPHWRVVSIGPHVVSKVLCTNRLEVAWQWTSCPESGPDGWGVKQVRVTNELWPVWSIFK